MTTPDPNNQLEQTDSYLEFLAGRVDKEPQLDPSDEEITKATRLLGTLREHDPRPVFIPKIKHAVLATSQHIPKTLPPPPHRFTALWLWKISAPVVAAGVVLVAVLVTRPTPTTHHAGTNFKKTQIAADQPAIVDLVATHEDSLGVEPTTGFILTAKSGTITAADVQKNFALNPVTQFTVTPKSASTYEIIPTAALTSGKVYAATYQATTTVDGQVQPRTYSWAYQVRNQFQIIGLLPRDQATGVSLNSGIEVTFSSGGVSADDFKKNLTIIPAIDGRVEVHQRTLVFIPTKPLSEKTVYTISVKQGLKATNATTGLAADTTWRFETTAKNSQDAQTISTSFFPSKLFESIRPQEPIIFSNTSYDPSAKPSTSQFTVYQYSDDAAFTKAVTKQESSRTAWTVFSARGSLYETDGLKKIGVYKTTTADGLTTLGPGWAAGFYLATGGTGSGETQLPFVVSDVASYSVTTRTDTLVWVNDLVTKQPIVGAKLTVSGITETVNTDAEGIARFSTPLAVLAGGTQSLVATLHDGSRETPILLNGGQAYGFSFSPFATSAATDYWSYLTTDRSLYQPDDTVQFWGLLRHRDQPRITTTITAQIIQQSFDTRYEPQVLATSTLTVNATGTFIGSLPLVGASPNTSTYLQITVDGQMVLNRYLTIETYRKPPYKITVTPDHLAVIAGDKVTYAITSAFFDGTPVPNLALKESSSGTNTTIVTTNAQGKATYTRVMTEQNSFFSLAPVDAQAEGLSGEAYVQVFPSALELTATTTAVDTTGTLTGTVNQILPANVQPGSADPLSAVHGPGQPNQKIDGKLIEIVYDKVQTGSHYDYLLKESVPDYQYNSHDTVVETFSLTSNNSGAFTKTFTLKADSVYRVELTAVDSKQRAATTTGYFWHSFYNNLYQGSQYSLTNTDERDGAAAPVYPIGAKVNLQVLLHGTIATLPTDGKILYLFNQRGLRRYDISTSPTETLTFGEGDVPSLATRGIVFTGAGYAEMVGPTILFDRASRKLTIAVTPDKPRYAPGDQVHLAIKATDPSGHGQSAHVNIKAIDEAFLALDQFGDSGDAPDMMYAPIDDGVLGTYVSHDAVTSRALAEGGGGGGDRTDFKDTAIFTEITTDAQGNGTLTFTLPDNLTSWRLTAQGFTDGLLAGKTQTSLVVNKDIFVSVALEPDQLSRDQTTVIAGTFGQGLTANDGVAYTFSIADVANSTTTLSAKAFSAVRFSVPPLAPGTYKVRVETKAKNSGDTVVLPLVVSASRLERREVNSVMLPSLIPIPYGTAGRTVFRFDDADRNLAYSSLWSVVGMSDNRLDDVVADQIARRLLSTTFNETLGGEPTDPTQFLTGQGAALYIIGSPNLESGALAAGDPSLAAGRQQLLSWFQGVLDDPQQNTEQIAEALYGLAQLGQPVLPDIRTVLGLPDLSDRDRLTLLLALEALGAKEEARPGALALLQKYGESQDQYFRLNLGDSDDEKIVASARFAILAAGLGLDQRYGLLRYLEQYPPRETRTTLEQALATERLLASVASGEASVTYEFNGTSATAKLASTKPLIISASPDEAKSLKIQSSTGKVSVVSTYQTPFDITQTARDPHLSLTRTYLVNNKKTTTFATGDLVKVQFVWTKKSGVIGKNFGVTDVLPTGLRPVSNPWIYDWNSKLTAPYAITGQRIQLYAGANGATFYYLARASTPGKTIAEPAILQAFDAPSTIQYSSETAIEIK